MPSWQEWGAFWPGAAADGLGQQREVMEWWVQFSQCCMDAECLTRKIKSLCERLAAATVAVTDAGMRLSQEQHRALAELSAQSQAVLQSGSPSAAQAFAMQWWPRMTDSARTWGTISAASQARVANALAEFWSLPTRDESGC